MNDPSDPLERRLRDSLSRHADTVAPAPDGWTAIRERAEREDRLLLRRRRTVRLAASGALAALVAVAVPLTLDRLRSADDDIAFAPPPVVTETATPAPSPSASPSSAPTGEPSATPAPTDQVSAAQGWAVVDDRGALSPGPYVYVNGAAAQGSRLVAVGSFSPSADVTQAAVWLADDDANWRRVDDAEAFGGEPFSSTRALAITATSRGFVAVGSTFVGDEADFAVAWTSPDGTSWERSELPGDGRALAVTEVAGGGLVAVGGGGPAIWTSADGGATWEATLLDALGDDGTLEHVVSSGDRVVAMGVSSLAISQDRGVSWTQIAHADAGLPQNVEDLVVLADGSLAAVVATDPGLVAYLSADGSSWEPAGPLPTSSQEDLARVGQIVALDDGALLAAGLVYDETAGPLAAVWSSADGARGWVRDDDATAVMGTGLSVTALVATADTLVAVGDAQRLPEVTVEDAGGRAWTRPLP